MPRTRQQKKTDTALPGLKRKSTTKCRSQNDCFKATITIVNKTRSKAEEEITASNSSPDQHAETKRRKTDMHPNNSRSPSTARAKVTKIAKGNKHPNDTVTVAEFEDDGQIFQMAVDTEDTYGDSVSDSEQEISFHNSQESQGQSTDETENETESDGEDENKTASENEEVQSDDEVPRLPTREERIQ